MENFDIGFTGDIRHLDSFTYAELTGADLSEIETDDYIKYYERVNDEWKLRAVEDENGEITLLTSIPDERFDKYKVDLDNGRIYSEVSDRFLKTKGNRLNYHYTTLAGIPIAVHVVVAMAKYQINRNEYLAEGKTVNHRDFNRGNNSANNLEIIYHRDQFCDEVRSRMGTGTRLSDEQVRHIKFIAEILKVKGTYAINKVSHYYSDLYEKDYVTIFNLLKGNTYKNVKLYKAQQKEIDRLRVQVDLERLSVLA